MAVFEEDGKRMKLKQRGKRAGVSPPPVRQSRSAADARGRSLLFAAASTELPTRLEEENAEM